ncbi:MAG: cytochrome c [Polyangiaceae bacterium]
MTSKLVFSVLAAASLAVACSAALPHATDTHVGTAQARWPGTSVQDLERGRSDYTKRCTGCHHLHLPHEFPPDAWQHAVDEMRNKHGVRISDDEANSILRYLITLSGEPNQKAETSRNAAQR